MVTRRKGSLGDVDVVICSVVGEDDIRCCGGVVGKVSRKMWANVSKRSVSDKVVYLASFSVGVSVA